MELSLSNTSPYTEFSSLYIMNNFVISLAHIFCHIFGSSKLMDGN